MIRDASGDKLSNEPKVKTQQNFFQFTKDELATDNEKLNKSELIQRETSPRSAEPGGGKSTQKAYQEIETEINTVEHTKR